MTEMCGYLKELVEQGRAQQQVVAGQKLFYKTQLASSALIVEGVEQMRESLLRMESGPAVPASEQEDEADGEGEVEEEEGKTTE